MRTLLLALCLALAPAASAQDAPSKEADDWRRRPTAEQLERHYPVLALLFGVQGRAVLLCTAQADGRLADCVVESETPAGWGFGAAALRLSGQFGVSTDLAGARIRTPVRFEVAD